MVFEFPQTTQVWVHYFKSFSRVKATQDEKMRFFKEIELNLTNLISYFYFFIIKIF